MRMRSVQQNIVVHVVEPVVEHVWHPSATQAPHTRLKWALPFTVADIMSHCEKQAIAIKPL